MKDGERGRDEAREDFRILVLKLLSWVCFSLEASIIIITSPPSFIQHCATHDSPFPHSSHFLHSSLPSTITIITSFDSNSVQSS